jgi:hypothetical protein
VGWPPFDDAQGVQHAVGCRWVRRLAPRGRGDHAARAAPRRLAWAGPAESIAGPRQHTVTLGQMPAHKPETIFLFQNSENE